MTQETRDLRIARLWALRGGLWATALWGGSYLAYKQQIIDPESAWPQVALAVTFFMTLIGLAVTAGVSRRMRRRALYGAGGFIAGLVLLSIVLTVFENGLEP